MAVFTLPLFQFSLSDPKKDKPAKKIVNIGDYQGVVFLPRRTPQPQGRPLFYQSTTEPSSAS
jgi:hypothetical protein